MNSISRDRAAEILDAAAGLPILVVGDVLLDQFVWGQVNRISPEAPVPVVEFEDESYMPGGAANVARNLTALGAPAYMGSWIGCDPAGDQVKSLLQSEGVNCELLRNSKRRTTGLKTRIVAQHQQLVRVDREFKEELNDEEKARLVHEIETESAGFSGIVVGDYGKGIVTQSLLDWLKDYAERCRCWISLDPKPIHPLDLSHLSLITPNRKEAFELAKRPYENKHLGPLEDEALLLVAKILTDQLQVKNVLITLGEQGMLLCRLGHPPYHIPTVAMEVFDVSGAGDTVIGTFTMAMFQIFPS